MKLAFRSDASLLIGSGHVMRCLALADALRAWGAECQFICREHQGHMMSLIDQRGYTVKALPASSSTFNSDSECPHAAWLGCHWEEDAEQTQKAIGPDIIDWLIVDHYALDRRWHQVLRPSAKHLMVIDDLADRPLDCDLLLDQNYGSSAARYAELVPQHCLQLHGPDYALLRPVYAECRATMRKRSGAIQRVLIFYGGGADHADIVGQTVQAFNHREFADVQLETVVSSGYEHLASLQAVAAQRGNIRLHSELPDLAELMAQSDLAIGAGGATTWERCCMGLPSIVISVAENQRPACEALARVGLIRYLGDASPIFSSKVQTAFRQLSQDTQRMSAMSAASMELVDGKGVDKVAEAIVAINAVEI